MGYTLYGAKAIKFTTTGSEQEYTLNKNFKINPDATKNNLQTAITRFNNLMVNPVDKIIVTSDTEYQSSALNKYEISYDDIEFSANAEEAVSNVYVNVNMNSINYYGAEAKIYNGPLTGYYYAILENYGLNTIRIKVSRIKITPTRGLINFIDLKVFYPEGQKSYTIKATITD